VTKIHIISDSVPEVGTLYSLGFVEYNPYGVITSVTPIDPGFIDELSTDNLAELRITLANIVEALDNDIIRFSDFSRIPQLLDEEPGPDSILQVESDSSV
jgi:hypothetical protein